ncbi:Pre-mRNA splicing factor [Babesia duncani]|uniref:Pre-mRNA splicing factor n=1 Tax=Babesia duncani TaxID=323732 RepID=A0AAD9PNM5_9APIC|nr:Pre-mRNA splicing factor [Babesia duncani]
MTAGFSKEDILKSDKQQWSISNKIEAEGLEWLYADPNAAENKEKEAEQYLLGKIIPGARGEFTKVDSIGGKSGSLLNESTSNRTYDDTVNLLREDPLFVIKKIEMQQKQIRDKYESLAKDYFKAPQASESNSRYNNDKRKESKDDRRDKYTSRRHHRESDESRHDRYDDRHDRKKSHRNRHHRDYHFKRRSHERERSHDSDDEKQTRRRSHSNHRDNHETSKRKKGPQLPTKDPIEYAFGVTDDILPPTAIQETAKRRELEMQKHKRMGQVIYADEFDDQTKLQEMQDMGVEHVQNKLREIEAMERARAKMEREAQEVKTSYIAKVQHQTFDSANLAQRIHKKAAKQRDLFNDDL